MNASEDHDEPLGEVPALAGFQVFGTDHLGGSPVGKFIATADEIAAQSQLVARQTQALDEIRQYTAHWSFSSVSREVRAILERHGL